MTDRNCDDVDFLGSFDALDDPRQQAKVLYPLPPYHPNQTETLPSFPSFGWG